MVDDPEYSEFPLRTFLDFTIDDGIGGEAVAALDVSDRHLNPNGVVHGGVVFTLVDTAMGRATMSVLEEGRICASIEVAVRYLRPITGGRLVATASVLQPVAGLCTWRVGSPWTATIGRWPSSRPPSQCWRPNWLQPRVTTCRRVRSSRSFSWRRWREYDHRPVPMTSVRWMGCT